MAASQMMFMQNLAEKFSRPLLVSSEPVGVHNEKIQLIQAL